MRVASFLPPLPLPPPSHCSVCPAHQYYFFLAVTTSLHSYLLRGQCRQASSVGAFPPFKVSTCGEQIMPVSFGKCKKALRTPHTPRFVSRKVSSEEGPQILPGLEEFLVHFSIDSLSEGWHQKKERFQTTPVCFTHLTHVFL